MAFYQLKKVMRINNNIYGLLRVTHIKYGGFPNENR